MSATLKQRVVRSGSWVILGHLFSQVLRLGGNLVLTRLLVPEMFGVMAIVTVIMGGLAMLSDVGLLQNIVQSKRGEEPGYLNTAWTIQIIRGFVIFIIALLASGGLYYLGQVGYLSADTVYGNEQLPIILAIVSITAVISSFNSIHILLLNRKLMLGKLISMELISQIVGLVFMLIWAWYQRDIWAFVFGGIITAFTKLLLSHGLSLGERCRFHWDRAAVHEIFHFGKWIFVSSILGFMLNQGDRLLLGGLISAEILGVYTVAFFLAGAITDILKKLVGSIFFPVLSEVVRNNPTELKVIYYKMRQKIDAVAMFSAGFIFSTASLIVNFLYDDRYGEAGWMLQVLSLALIGTGSLLASQVFLSIGKPKLETTLVFLQVVCFYISVPILFYYYDIFGAILAIACYPVIRLLFSMYLMKRFVFFSLCKEMSMFPLTFVGFLLGEIVIRLLK